MKTKTRVLSWLGCITILAALICTPALAFAQSNSQVGVVGGLVIFILVAGLYIYQSLALQTIADNTNTPNSWLAWVPIANLYLMVRIAEKPAWWFILFLVPLVGIVIIIIVWMAIAERC